ncbi:MAG: TonB-dependent receptor [Pseudomonadota bacterium]
MKHALLRTTAVATLSSGVILPALAQEPNDDVITVTAQRVEQDIQDVPISVSAVSGEELTNRAIDSFDQLQYVVPNVSFANSLNARVSATTIRGIGTGLFNPGIEGSVALALDGVVIGREGAGVFDFADVERVEVLRGPQGTLFGKNASAGVINVVTKRPTDEFEGELRAAYGSFNEVNLYGAVSGPLTDRVRGRVSAYSNRRDGFIDNVNPDAPQSEVNDRDEWGVRGKLAVDLSDTAEWLISADYVSRDQAQAAFTYRQESPGGPGTGLLGFGVPVISTQSEAAGITPSPSNRSIASNGFFQTDAETFGVSSEAVFGIGGFDLVSLTAYRGWNNFDNNDADLIDLPLLAVNNSDLELRQVSQEFRLVSPQEDRFAYTVGLFYFDQEIDQRQIITGTAGLDLLGSLPPGVLLGTDMVSDIEETNYAVFGQAEFDATERLSLIGGFRLLNSEVSGRLNRQVADGAVGPYAGQNVTPEPLSAETEDTALVWRFGLQYFVNDDVNVFATATKGYKSAGVVSEITVDAVTPGGTDLPVVDPEVPLQYELGVRSQSAGGRLTANLTAFFTQIDDFQAQALVPLPGGLTNFTVANAGSVETYGVEGDVTWLPTDNLTLSTAFAYTKATIDEYDNAPCYALQTEAQGCVVSNGQPTQDLAGGELANAPEWTVNGLARYDFDLTSSLPAFAQVGFQYRGETFSNITNDPNMIIDSYTLVDAQVGVTFAEGRGTLALFGRNIFDEDFVEAIINMPFDTGGYAQYRSFEAEQTWGVRLDYAF